MNSTQTAHTDSKPNGAVVMTASERLSQVAAEQDKAALLKRIAELEAKNAQLLETRRGPGITVKVRRLDRKYPSTTGEEQLGKGNILMYGFGRFPKSFYPKEILAILDKGDEIRAQIEANKDGLSWAKIE